MAGDEEVFEVHEACDGQPALDAGGARDLKAHAAALIEAHPEVKLEAEPEIQGGEQGLHGETDALRAVRRGAAGEMLLGSLCGFDDCGLRAHLRFVLLYGRIERRARCDL